MQRTCTQTPVILDNLRVPDILIQDINEVCLSEGGIYCSDVRYSDPTRNQKISSPDQFDSGEDSFEATTPEGFKGVHFKPFS